MGASEESVACGGNRESGIGNRALPILRRCVVAGALLFFELASPVLADGQQAPPSQQVQVPDPLGRETPRGTVREFNEAVRSGDLGRAARFLQLPAAASGERLDTLARQLSELLDRYFVQPISSINASPTGALDDGLSADRERVGVLRIGARDIGVELVRIEEPPSGLIWLISNETLAQVPTLHRAITAPWIERVLPPFFTRHRIFGHSLAQMVGLASSLLIPLVVLYLLTEVLIRVLRRTEDLQRHQLFETWFASLRWPAILFLSLMIHLGGARVMGLALTFRLRYGRVLVAVIVFTAAWLLRRLLALGFERARTLMPGAMHGGTRSLLLLAERLAKAFVVVVAIVVILGIAGVDTLTSLAGLGIGGIALALGAQKTVENFLGGVFLLSDRALAVGDKCTIGNRLGFVEDITLRSVRLRTMEQTLLSIPAGTLSQSNVENWATRTKSLIQQRVPLRYGTSADQLRAILGSIAGFLAEHPRIERGSARIRLVDFGERAIELEIFCYVLTGEVPQYLIVKEEVLLRIATIVEAEGSGFARPTQFVYMDSEFDGPAPAREVVHDIPRPRPSPGRGDSP